MWQGEEWEMEGDSAEIVTEVSVEPRCSDTVPPGGQEAFSFIKFDVGAIYKVCQMHFSHFISSEL